MGMNDIQVRGLTKRFGSTVALDRLTFDASPGTVTGFLGPNGAGKSTTMRMIIGLDRPDEGSALINRKAYRDLRWPLHEVGAMLNPRTSSPAARPGPTWRPSPPGTGYRRSASGRSSPARG
jgi:ABC-type multidrug transport system ATPase subunit